MDRKIQQYEKISFSPSEISTIVSASFEIYLSNYLEKIQLFP